MRMIWALKQLADIYRKDLIRDHLTDRPWSETHVTERVNNQNQTSLFHYYLRTAFAQYGQEKLNGKSHVQIN